MRTRALWLLVVGLGLAACRDRALSTLATDLSVDPVQLDFGDAWRGSPLVRTVTVTNRSRAAVDFQVRATSPFSAIEHLSVPGSSGVELAVTFEPQSEGPAAATLTLEAEGLALLVPLTGAGLTPPTCTASSECLSSRFDPATGACIETSVLDGASCRGDGCVTNGTCRAGACVGAPVVCADGDACTTDFCVSAQGCQHASVTCAPPTNPCQAAACDPLFGCRAAPVVDGTSCGENDCQTAHVCIAGACVERPAPDGSTCGVATTCRAAGTCERGACSVPPLQVPAPRWQYTPPAGRYLLRAAVDPRGNTYALVGTSLVTATDGGPFPRYELELLSFDLDGHVRFTVDVGSRTPGLENGVALLVDPDEDRVVLAARTYNWGTSVATRVVVAQARSATTGQLLWEHDLRTGIPTLSSSTGVLWLDVLQEVLLDHGDVAFSMIEGEELHQSYVLGLSGSTGEELWRVVRSGHLHAGGTGNGEVWEDSAPCWSSDSYVSRITSAGVVAARAPMGAALLAFDHDRAMVQLYQPSQLAWVSPALATTPLPLPAGQVGPSWYASARLEGPLVTVLVAEANQRWLDRYDQTTGSWTWTRALGESSWAQLWLLRDGGTATYLGLADGGSELVTHSGDGEELERCPYGATQGLAVSNGRYFTQRYSEGLTTFDLPGRDSATSGWTGPSGFAGTGRAR